MFKVEDKVFWTGTHAKFLGGLVAHSGKVIAVIPAGKLPIEVDPQLRGVAATAVPRTEESYVILAKGKKYWPRVKQLVRQEKAFSRDEVVIGKRQAGFTLIEVLIVVAIVFILLFLAVDVLDVLHHASSIGRR